ncbi:hypothetical protein HN51_029636 [Arachis hypogaea]|nr:aluminum-activated malate transporter 14-like [Arachis hypogaea]QHO36314.1 Aluminum-activated malate transporter [Arachis hypogaea]
MTRQVHPELDVEVPPPFKGDSKISAEETRSSSGKEIQKKKCNEGCSFADKVRKFPESVWTSTVKVGREDPRRVVHAFKFGVALTFVSLFYMIDDLYNALQKDAMFAVFTVVVVMEFTVGATLCKGLNRALGTVLAACLAVLIDALASSSTKILTAIIVGVSVFLVGSGATYARFIPHIKKNLDYGVVVFILTFNLVTVSSYRDDNVLRLAQSRMLNIAVGCMICLVMCLLVFPNWSGKYLQDSITSKLESLGNCIEVCVKEYFCESDLKGSDDGSIHDHISKDYKGVLDSKAAEDTLILHARWEPRYTSFHRIPWKQFGKVGDALRHFCYTVVALHGCLKSEIQAPWSIRNKCKNPCIKLAEEANKILKELSNSIKDKRQVCPHILNNGLNKALEDLNNALKSQPQLHFSHTLSAGMRAQGPPLPPDSDDGQMPMPQLSKSMSKTMSVIVGLEFSEALPLAAFTSLLLDMVAKLEYVIDEVELLGRMAHFREYRSEDEFSVRTEERPKPCSELPAYGA